MHLTFLVPEPSCALTNCSIPAITVLSTCTILLGDYAVALDLKEACIYICCLGPIPEKMYSFHEVLKVLFPCL